MERNLALEVVRATEAAALAASRFIGKGDERMADRAACDAMRKTLNSVAMDGKIVIGEGKEGDAEFLYEGEIVGTGAGTAGNTLADIPLTITGTTTSPNVRPDLEALAKARIQQELDQHKGEIQQKLMDKLKGVFK